MKGKFKKCLTLLSCALISASMLYTAPLKAASETTPIVSLSSSISSGISQTYVIEPQSSSQEIELTKLAIRYYYEKNGTKPQTFYCDVASLSLNTAPYYVDYTKNVTSTFKENFLEINFTQNYRLSNGKLTLGVRLNQSDWSSYENFKEKKLEVIYDGKVVSTKVYDEEVPSETQPPVTSPPVTSPPETTPPVTPEKPSTILPKVSNMNVPGPFAVTIDKGYGPNGKAWIARPTNPGTLGVTAHPIFIWSPGGGGVPADDENILRLWASQGFVVYCEESQWSGQQAVDGLNWMIEQNENPNCPLYRKMDITRIAAGGFSLGSSGAWAVASDPRIKTTIHCDGGSLDGLGASRMRKPTCLINGLEDGLACGNTKRDYAGATVPVWFGGIIGGGHGAGRWDGLPAVTAWLRWHLADETEIRNMFLTPNGTFNTGIWKSQYKNW